MGYLLIRPLAKYCSSDLYMYEVGHGSAEASEEIQASTVYISVYISIITDSIRYIPNFSVIRKLHKHTGELSYFRTSAGENPLKLILSNSQDCFRCNI